MRGCEASCESETHAVRQADAVRGEAEVVDGLPGLVEGARQDGVQQHGVQQVQVAVGQPAGEHQSWTSTHNPPTFNDTMVMLYMLHGIQTLKRWVCN